ncbi:MAG: SpoIIE family protein phosphatase [Candidatus Eremiobacteraeota bacterium]|nr:SpoIIE family protein phosphatase [Candidatus Eremiobacteraeota bacterium]
MPQLVWAAAADGTIDYFNHRWIEFTGLTLEELLSKDGSAGVVHPDELDETWARWKASIASGTPYEMEHRLRNAADGGYRWFLNRGVPILDARGNVSRWIGTATEIDGQRRSHDNLAFIVDAGNALAASLDPDEICSTIARVTVESFADWCFIFLQRDGGLTTVATAHRNPRLAQQVGRFMERYADWADGALKTAIDEKRALLVEQVSHDDVARLARDAHHLQILELLQMRSFIIAPLVAPNGIVYGAVKMIAAESGRLFNQTDLKVAATVAMRGAAALMNATVFEAERQATQRLRFSARVSQLLLETTDLWTTMDRIATMIAAEMADACAISRLDGDALRTEVVVHRDAVLNAVVSTLRGKRTLRPEAERELVGRLHRHGTIVREREDAEQLAARAWPYLAAQMSALKSKVIVTIPLYSGSATYGAIAAYYSDRPYDAENDLSLLEEIAARASVALEREETLERERHIATTLQRASLPTIIPQPEGLHFDVAYLPAGEESAVGGDWYDAIDLDDGSVVISTGDVTGRGIEAAAIMSKVRHAMAAVPRHESDPARILDSAGWFLGKRYPDAIVTAFVAIISPDRRTLRYANAGHPRPLLRRDGAIFELQDWGLPLGLRQFERPAQTRSAELRDGDLLVLYTDGLVEWNHDIEEGEQRLQRVVASEAVMASVAPAKLIQRACLPPKALDDVAILTVAVGVTPAWSFAAEDARAAIHARSNFAAFLRSRTNDEDSVGQAELIFGELLGNIVQHAPGPVEIQLFCDGRGAFLHVIDSGPPFDFSNSLPKDVLSERGRGLFIVRHIASAVVVEHIPNFGNHISVRL